MRFTTILLPIALTAAVACAPRKTEPVEPVQEEPVVPPRPDFPMGQDLMAAPLVDNLSRLTYETAPSRATTPDAADDGMSFVYASNGETETYQIYHKTVDAPAARRLSFHHANHLFPRLSPDGRWVAYCSDIDGNWNIYFANLDAPGQMHQLTNEDSDEMAPAWSPDGRQIAYMQRSAGGGAWRVWTVDTRSRMTTLLGPGMYPDWTGSADGEWIAFQSSNPAGRWRIERMRPDGGERQDVANFPDWSALSPRWDSTGGWLFFTRWTPEREDFGGDTLYMIRADGGFRTELRRGEEPVWWPCFGGNRVFFIAERNGNENVYMADIPAAAFLVHEDGAVPAGAEPESP